MTNNKEKYSFSFVNFDAHKPPVFAEVKNKEWIIYGADKEYYNNYGQYLIDNYDKSAIHNAICNGKVNYIVGNGLKVESFNTVQDLAMSKALIRSVNSEEDADDLNRKLATDLTLFGGFYVELINNRVDGLSEVYHLDFNSIRRSKEDDKVWFYTSDWSSRKPQQNEDFKTFYTFEGTFEQGKDYLLEYRGYRAGNGAYALPDYLAANSSIETDWRISNYLLNNVKSGFSAGFLINFYNGMPTEEEKKYIEKQIKSKFTGDDNGGSFVLNFNDAESKSAEIVPIPTNGNDDRFNLLEKQVNSKLFIAHSCTSPILFGVKTEGQLGGRTELVEAMEIFQNTYVNNRQRILEKFWNDLLTIKEVNATLEIIDTKPITEKLSEQARLSVMTQDEIREELGLEPLQVQKTVQNKFNDSCCSKTKFQDDKDTVMLEHFEGCGWNDEELEVVYRRDLVAGSIEDAKKFAEVTSFQNEVLSLLRDNPKLPPQEIAKALEVETKQVMDALDNLQIEGLIDIVEGQVNITDDGINEAEQEELFTVYKYKERDDAPELEPGGSSRQFCRIMLGMSQFKSWTIEDIERLNNGQGLDVFTSRGGWYRKPQTTISVPFCRHIWEQRLVRKKA